MFFKNTKRIQKLENKILLLEKRILLILEKYETNIEEKNDKKQVTVAQVTDEWLNGKRNGDK